MALEYLKIPPTGLPEMNIRTVQQDVLLLTEAIATDFNLVE